MRVAMVGSISKIKIAISADAPSLGVIGPATYAASYGYLWDDPLARLCAVKTHGYAAKASPGSELQDRAGEETDQLIWLQQSLPAWVRELAGLAAASKRKSLRSRQQCRRR